jgi:hypothetical protein
MSKRHESRTDTRLTNSGNVSECVQTAASGPAGVVVVVLSALRKRMSRLALLQPVRNFKEAVAAADAENIASTCERVRQVGSPFASLPGRVIASNWGVV